MYGSRSTIDSYGDSMMVSPEAMRAQTFVPETGHETEFSFDQTPTYLFRVYDPASPGITSTEEVTSQAMHDRYKQAESDVTDLLSLPPGDAAKRLSHHLSWVYYHEKHCNLMSWSSSLLFVLQYGLFRHVKVKQTPLSEIQLIMIDTREFPKQTFLRDLDAIQYFLPYSTGEAVTQPGGRWLDLEALKKKREADMYFGEYLTQGRLDIRGKYQELNVSNIKYDPMSEKMAELKQFREVMESVKRDRTESLLTQSLSAMEKLTV
ncbi:hypothetical protein FHETE_5286 [Fusarium heterosporum]|uniref:DUF7587 domain-containing protein n=1 Tax=Fusarium heterosporum TaxID=42747 RepID=A0A8H5T9X5_FUSHE|nr:hypothetical protein FHETE_5286 [Fusarium heterosporum]